ncbi:MAG: ComF family protein [Alphaproteobacteria bacterium]
MTLERMTRAGSRLLDLLLPPRCLKCGCQVQRSGTLCTGCWNAVQFLGPPQCARCGYPFEFDAGSGSLCAQCTREEPEYGRARAVFRYDAASRGLILAFKYSDRTDAALAFGHWLMRAGHDLLADADLIAPVPLHWTRLFARRYNQAALLANALARASGIPAAPALISRRRRTPSQGGLGAEARRRNVRSAFGLSARAREQVEGRRVILVDDVLTTGATVNECARLLLGAGAKAVDVLTLARVVRERA